MKRLKTKLKNEDEFETVQAKGKGEFGKPETAEAKAKDDIGHAETGKERAKAEYESELTARTKPQDEYAREILRNASVLSCAISKMTASQTT